MATPTHTIRFIRLPEVIRTSGLSRSQIYRLCSSGRFPQSVKLGEATTAWVEAEVQRWCAAQVEVARSRETAA
ncbi:AlpA family transcriptional regulator [Dyella sp. C9]|uniref:helix-turn-helix transcriptional regulator n=1 Tax=Dyella sp. C9 TaxID=2202154 RepID=UPI000DEFEA20|nr:AlpA family transcriptional regulator [Dyella sp. C9]